MSTAATAVRQTERAVPYKHISMKNWYLFTGLLICIACRPGALPPEAYLHWVEDPAHGLRQSKTLGPLVFTIQYQPAPYRACQLALRKGASGPPILGRDSMPALQQIQLRISSADGHTPVLRVGHPSREHYQQRLRYLAFGLEKRLFLLEGQDTLPCNLFHLERAYDLAPFVQGIARFEAERHPDQDKTFLLLDDQLGLGPVQMRLSYHSLSTLPTLSTP